MKSRGLLTRLIVVIHLDWDSMGFPYQEVLVRIETDAGHTLAGYLIKVQDDLTTFDLVAFDLGVLVSKKLQHGE